MLGVDYRLSITSIMHQQLWGCKVEQKIYLVVLRKKKVEYHWFTQCRDAFGLLHIECDKRVFHHFTFILPVWFSVGNFVSDQFLSFSEFKTFVVGEIKKSYNIFVGKLERKRP
jgi:hypothetical protein